MKIDEKASAPARRKQERTITFLTQDEVRRLFSVIKHKRDRAIFAVAYRHGLRASEVGLLQRTDVDLKQGHIAIHRLKGSFSGVYPMKPDTVKLIRSYLRERTNDSPYLFLSNRRLPIDRRTLYVLMRKYGEAAAYRRTSGSSTPSSAPSPPTSWTLARTPPLPGIGWGTRTSRTP